MAHESGEGDGLLRESRAAEMALIDAETRAEQELARAEARYRRALDKFTQAQARMEASRRDFEQARAQLDQRQLERAAGPMLRRLSVARPSLPRPARDDSRARKRNGPAPEGAGPEPNESE